MTTTANPTILDGKALSKKRIEALGKTIEMVQTLNQPKPKLVVVLVGDDPASKVYVNKKAKTAKKIGMDSEVITLPADCDENTLRRQIIKLNQDESVHGILVQLPLPKHMDTLSVLSLIAPEKDVDGLHPLNLGKLLGGHTPLAKPCTPTGIMTLFEEYNIPLSGKHAVVVGRSNIVGKPIGIMLLDENATVTYCHSRTQNLSETTRKADILVVATGIPNMIGADDVKEGAVVIDVGINRVDDKLVGDVDFDAVAPKVSHITPVPGGVGPMTIATLMENTLSLYSYVMNAETKTTT